MTTFNETGGIVTYTVPTTGIYDIVAYGAQGGGGAGGLGAEIGGDVSLTAGEVLTIAVGGQGGTYNRGYSGGGGSFVVGLGSTPQITRERGNSSASAGSRAHHRRLVSNSTVLGSAAW